MGEVPIYIYKRQPKGYNSMVTILMITSIEIKS